MGTTDGVGVDGSALNTSAGTTLTYPAEAVEAFFANLYEQAMVSGASPGQHWTGAAKTAFSVVPSLLWQPTPGAAQPGTGATKPAQPAQPAQGVQPPTFDELPQDPDMVAAWTAWNAQFPIPPVELDSHGWAKTIGVRAEIAETSLALARQIRAIVAAFAGGAVIGRNRARMLKFHKYAWLTAWFNGDFAAMYCVEASLGEPHPLHPGRPESPHTNRLIWQPDVEDEIPAGQAVPGDWGNGEVGDWGNRRLENYLYAAGCRNTDGMHAGVRVLWVRAHFLGDRYQVDRLNDAYANVPLDARDYRPAVWHADLQPRSTEPDLTVPPSWWTATALRAYAARHNLPFRHTYRELVAQVSAHHRVVPAVLSPTLSRLPDQPSLSGYHRKVWLTDGTEQYLFKPAPEGKRFRADTEHQAHLIARRWGYHTAQSRLVTFEDTVGQLQHRLPIKQTFAGNIAGILRSLTVEQLCAVACEHVLDWALDNDDCHGDNLAILEDGSIVGIDKGRAWRYFGAWPGLAGTTAADTNCHLVYTVLYRLIREHTFTQATVDRIYGAVLAQARHMQLLPDDVVEAHVRAAVAHRPHYHPSSYQRPVVGAAASEADLVRLAVARKNGLHADLHELWTRLYHDAGWTCPEPGSRLSTNAQGYPLYTELHSPETHAALRFTGSFGTPVFCGGPDVKDAHVLLWQERHAPSATMRVRGELRARHTALDSIHRWCTERAVDDHGAAPTVVRLRFADEFVSQLVSLADQHNWHVPLAGTEQVQTSPTSTVDAVDAIVARLIHIRDHVDELTEDYPDMMGIPAAAQAMAVRYLGYAEQLRAALGGQRRVDNQDWVYYWHTWQPPRSNARVRKTPATRAATARPSLTPFTADGVLEVGDETLRDSTTGCQGQPGSMFLITLDGGEEIEVRAGTSIHSQRGMIRFTIPDAANTAEGLARITDQLTEMGLSLRAADEQDLELFYWRHLAGVMQQRRDSHRDAPGRFSEFWARAQVTVEEDPYVQLAKWRDAFAVLGQVEDFLATREYLPHLGRQNLWRPTQPCGKPYWVRFDVPVRRALRLPMPALGYRTGPLAALRSGVALSTEGRVRVLATWKCGVSSAEDLRAGSSGFIFMRQNQETNPGIGMSLYFNPEILRRTTNYAYDDDQYGRQCQQSRRAHFTFHRATNLHGSSNELLVHDALSLLDDVELVAFRSLSQLQSGLAFLHALGITELRGLPLEDRFVVMHDHFGHYAAVQRVRQHWHRQHRF